MTAAEALGRALKDSGWKEVEEQTDKEQQVYDKHGDRLVVVERDAEVATVYLKADEGEL